MTDEQPVHPVSRFRRPGRKTVAAVVLLSLAGWLAAGFYTIEPNERGVVLVFGRVVHRDVQPGIHYAPPWPVGTVYKPETTDVRRVEVGYAMLGRKFTEPRRSDMLTGDENIMKIMMVVQYKIRPPANVYLFSTEDPTFLIERAVDSALNQVVAGLPVDDVLTTAKTEIQTRTLAMAQKMLDKYGVGVVLLGGNLQDVYPPAPVSDAFVDVASAKKDSERKVDQARAYATRALSSARVEAQQQVNRARGDAADRVLRAEGDSARFLKILPEYNNAKRLTRLRLYLETLERVFSQSDIIILETPTPPARTRITVVQDE